MRQWQESFDRAQFMCRARHPEDHTGFLTLANGDAALRARGQAFSSVPEIGAATGIEFLPGGLVRAAAEPVRRGGGSAMVEHPLP